MGLDIEILENEYNKIAADRAEVEARTDLTDEERTTVLAGFDRALEGLESGVLALGKKTKEDIQKAIKDLESKIAANEEYIKSAEQELAQRQAEIEEEMAKENPDQGIIEAKQAEVKALEKRIKSLKSATRKIKKEVKEQNKLLIPLMKRFKDKIFTEQEIADLEKLDKKIQSGKALSEKRKAAVEEPVVAEETAKEEPAVEEVEVEEAAVEGPDKEEPAVAAPDITEPVEVEPPAVEEETVEEAAKEETDKTTSKKTVAEKKTPIYVTFEEPKEEKTAEEEKVTPEAEKGKSLKEEFNELYVKAKKGTLTQDDYTRLGEIVSVPANYDELGITTGIINNKARVVIKAMGKFATKDLSETVKGARDNFGIEAKKPGDEIISTPIGASWAGAKTMAKTPNMKLASQEVFERVVAKAEEKGIENLNDKEKNAYTMASKHLKNIEDYRKCIDAYAEVKEQRTPKIFGWLTQNIAPAALKEAEAEVIEDTVPEVEEKATESNEEEFTWEYTEGEYYEVEDSFVAGLKSATRSDAEVSTVGDSEAKTAEKDDKADDMVI